MIHHKLESLPPIYYFNLEHRSDRREYLEKQFLDYGINQKGLFKVIFRARAIINI